jgi:co-chaperonin GroES (HSP10)
MEEMKQNEIPPIISAKEIIPLHKDVLIQDLYFGEQITPMGIVLIDDDKKSRGIHARWAKVYAVGHDNHDLIPGQWVLVEHGRWSRGVQLKEQNIVIRRADPKAILGYSNSDELAKISCFDGKE